MSKLILRYVTSSKNSPGPLVAIQADLPKMIVTREAAFPVEYGVKGRELMDKLRWACIEFVRAMELQGLTVIALPDGNPLVVTDERGVPYGTYSITKDLEKSQPDELIDAETGGLSAPTMKQPQSLDDSYGLVDYRIVGVFWAPQISVEIAKRRSQILDDEQAAKNPTTYGSGQSTPRKPSIAR